MFDKVIIEGVSAGNYSYLSSILLTKNDRDLVTLLYLNITIQTCKQALLSIANGQVYPDEMRFFYNLYRSWSLKFEKIPQDLISVQIGVWRPPAAAKRLKPSNAAYL